MKTVIEKITSYNIFNYLIPGAAFVVFGDKLTSIPLIPSNWILGLFLYYVIGLIVSRMGSLIYEPLLTKTKFIQFENYKNYIKAAQMDSKIDVLSEQNNMYRTLSSLFMSLILLVVYDRFKDELVLSDNTQSLILLAVLAILFLFSYRKQTKFVVQRIKTALSEE